jgi:DNA-binding transcriptional LysR family regulator
MSIRHLRTLLAIRDHGSFSAAADAILITHAAVSQQIKTLEAQWNIVLFDRRPRSPQLTPLGHAFAAKAEAVVRAYDNLRTEVVDGAGFDGEIGLGAVPTTLTGLVPLAVSQLKTQFNRLHVVIQPGLSTALLQQIERRQIDAAIITRPAILPRGFAFLEVATEPLELLAPPQTTNDDPLFLLTQHPFIRFDRNALVGQMVEAWLQEQNIVVQDSMELEDLEAISSMVMANLGVSIVPQRCVDNMNPLPVKKIALGPDGPSRQLGLAHRTDSPKMRVIEAVHKTLLDAVANGRFSAPLA